MSIFLVGLFLIATSGLPSIVGRRSFANASAYLGGAMMMAGALGLVAVAVPVLLGGPALTLHEVELPVGTFSLTIDALSGSEERRGRSPERRPNNLPG